MAEHDLIQVYLDDLRRRLWSHRDVDDIVAEAEDHLREVAAAHVRAGMDVELAQRHALGLFGTTTLVQRAFTSTRHGGAAVPTTLTKAAGLAAMAGGILMVTVFAIGSTTDLDVGENSGWFAPLGTTAFTLVLVGVVGIHLRHRAIYSGAGRVGRWLIPIGVVGAVASVLTWLGPGVILAEALIAVGLILMGVDVWGAGVVDRRAVALIAVGIPAVMAVTLFGHSSFGWPTIVSVLAFAGTGAGFAWLGYCLWREEPTTIRPPTAAA